MKGKYWRTSGWLWSLVSLLTALVITVLLVASPALASHFDPMELPQATPVVTCLALCGDLGDAPVLGMTAYPTATVPVTAAFPTIYSAGAASGPFHLSPENGPYLGDGVSLEKNAHQLPDEDGITNIDIANDKADEDGADDGVSWIPSLADCAANSFNVYLTVPANGYTGTLYANVWFDFERDGDWNDEGLCGSETVSEWAIQNRGFQLSPGTHVFTATVGGFHPAGMEFDPLWMRITLSDTPVPVFNGYSDGRGPAAGFLYGETEDYFLKYYDGSCDTCSSQAGWQG